MCTASHKIKNIKKTKDLFSNPYNSHLKAANVYFNVTENFRK